MAIFICEGKPGSGKSYFAVKYIADYCTIYDEFYEKHILKDGYLIVTNIKDLKIEHKNFDFWWKKLGKKVLTVSFWEEIIKKGGYKKVILIIDEAQKYLYGLKDKEVFFLFQYHRHLGMDIFLLTQTVKALPKEIVELTEFIYKALPQSRSTPFFFTYHLIDPTTKEKLGTKRIKKDNRVFRLYTSQELGDLNKPPNMLIKYLALFLAGVIIIPIGFYTYINHVFAPPKKNNPPTKVSTPQPKKEKRIHDDFELKFGWIEKVPKRKVEQSKEDILDILHRLSNSSLPY